LFLYKDNQSLFGLQAFPPHSQVLAHSDWWLAQAPPATRQRAQHLSVSKKCKTKKEHRFRSLFALGLRCSLHRCSFFILGSFLFSFCSKQMDSISKTKELTPSESRSRRYRSLANLRSEKQHYS
jgi:hypothetical protein